MGENRFMATFIFPDIHGCSKTLKFLIEERVQPSLADTLVFLGDYIDRGPNSAETIGYIINLQKKGFKVVALRGNHEQMLINSLYDSEKAALWMLNGGSATVDSYRRMAGGNASSFDELIPDEHVAFFLKMPFYYGFTDSVYAVHGGINFPIVEDDESFQRMLWLRPWACASFIPLGYTVIHGHTPVSLPEVEQQVLQFGSLVNLDAGCVYAGRHPNLGFLTCLNLEQRELFFCANMEQ